MSDPQTPQTPQTPQQPTPEKKKRNPWLIGCAGIVGLLLLCGVIGSLTSTPTARQNALATAGTEPTVVTTVNEPTAVPVVTDAPEAPTASPAPTNTPAPTAEPTAIPPTPEPPPPVSVSGSGQDVTQLEVAALSRVELTHTGQRNFIVKAIDAKGNEELLVNAIGSYEGIRWLDAGRYTFEVQADGDWTITATAMGRDDAAASNFEGTGDSVSGVFMAPSGNTAYTFTHAGERNFIVYAQCANGSHLLVNDIGATEGAALLRADGTLCFWDVQADGAWAIAPK